jgi:mercuric ion transport protein
MSDLITQQRRASGLLSYLALFTSFGTLLCCALPSLLVLLGLGATVASFLSAVPWLVTLSRHKIWVFAISGLLIGANLLYVYVLRRRPAACSPDAPEACAAATRWSRIVLWISVAIYAIGVFSAFILGPLLVHFVAMSSASPLSALSVLFAPIRSN